jgi:hypothetical protein
MGASGRVPEQKLGAMVGVNPRTFRHCRKPTWNPRVATLAGLTRSTKRTNARTYTGLIGRRAGTLKPSRSFG